MNDLNAKLEKIYARIALACTQSGRLATEISLLAVSKGHSADQVRQLNTAGQSAYGENYLQEALHKQQALKDLTLDWHFIGPVQANKTREIARNFQWVQSVDRDKILMRLSDQRPVELPPLNVCLQVNIDRESQKSGAQPEQILQLSQLAQTLPRLRLRGLMAIPRADNTPSDALRSFQAMYGLFCRLRENGLALDTLSMGMSADLELAIRAGSTMIRVGTDLFGSRSRDP
jgi:pyridoxal phosphate enzyme (YggS family)